MKKRFSILRFAGAICLALCAGLLCLAIADQLHVCNPIAAFGVGGVLSLAASLIPNHPVGLTFMALSTEVWVDRIEHNFYKNNDYLMQSQDDSQYVEHKTVHIPNAGAPPTITIDGAYDSGGTDVTTMTDTDREYSISEFKSLPFVVRNAEEAELSYPKMDSILFEVQSAMVDKVADKMISNWAPTGTQTLSDGVTVNANILRTSGVAKNNLIGDRARFAAHLAGANGNRLGFGMYDVLQAQTFLNSLNIPMSDRYMLCSAKMYAQLIGDLSATQYTDFSSVMDADKGIVGRLFGFTFYTRSSVLSYTNDDTPVVRALGAAGTATDNDAVLFWWKGALSRAKGEIKVFNQDNDPKNYGNVVSILARAGGASRRSSELGVGVIVQTATA